ncbi:MAG TPA: response regulator transcription factor [Candidatus Paceibacterota bacterium]|jgi:DNA-binding response OmpR family regulator|nr:response regulator transcription factor [Candidatus Paceibacterota bacterium]
MRILLIEDDSDMQDFLKGRLKERGFAVDTADTGTRGIFLAKTNEYDVIILDYGLPEKNGFVVCQEIRKDSTVPIIMLSVSDSPDFKTRGLTIGADDYVSKPFSFEELYARIQAILRRPQTMQSHIFTIDDLVLDSTKQNVTRAGKVINLTRKEFALLEYLLKHKGNVVTRGMLMEHIWDTELDPFSNTIETHILNLRKKIENPEKPKLIHSVSGRGYKIEITD